MGCNGGEANASIAVKIVGNSGVVDLKLVEDGVQVQASSDFR